MRMIIEGGSPEFEQKLLALFAEHRDEFTLTADTEWTVDRAERYLRSLPAGARRFARMVVDGDGAVDADRLRAEFERGLRGPSHALSRALARGVREGWWPEGTPAPVTVVYDPANPSWKRAHQYVMADENVPVFRKAFARGDNGGTGDNGGGTGGTGGGTGGTGGGDEG